jgi:hypothetical protein
MKIFKINDSMQIVCDWQNTRYGFRHLATLLKNNNEIAKAKVCYYNHTWESFEYETVISCLFNKYNIFSAEQKSVLMQGFEKDEYAEINRQFGFIANIAKIGSLLTDNQKDANDWKKRMLNAGLADKGLTMPDDWEQLSEDEKQKRLDNVINHLQNVQIK